MYYRCNIEIAPNGIQISSPAGKGLPGRMLRTMVQNLEKNYQVFEYLVPTPEDDIAGLEEEAVGKLPLKGGREMLFLGLDRSFYDENAVQLTREQIEDVEAELPEGEEVVVADLTVAYNDEGMYAVVTDNLPLLVRTISHLAPKDEAQVVKHLSNLAEGLLTIRGVGNNHDILRLDFSSPITAQVLLEGMEEWLSTPSTASALPPLEW